MVKRYSFLFVLSLELLFQNISAQNLNVNHLQNIAKNKLEKYEQTLQSFSYPNLSKKKRGDKEAKLYEKYANLFYDESPLIVPVVKDYDESTNKKQIHAREYYNDLVKTDYFENLKVDFLEIRKKANKKGAELIKIGLPFKEDGSIVLPTIIVKKVLGITTNDNATINNDSMYFYVNWRLKIKENNPNKIDKDKSGIFEITPCEKNKVDTDNDTVVDIIDNCPEEAGDAENGGCPSNDDKDPDGDGIKGNKDLCPNVAGTQENNGCPPTTPPVDDDPDKDTVKGVADKCPNVPGDPNHQGCPDSDGDGFFDDIDKCPKDRGTEDGCPPADKDKDGVIDSADKCPEKFGDPNHQGCPDSDGDGTYDDIDKCIDKAGPTSNAGCPIPPPDEIQALQALQLEGKTKVESFLKITNSVASKNSNPAIELTTWNALFDPKQSGHRIGISSYQRKNRVDTVLATNYLDRLHNLNYDRVNVESNEINIHPHVDKVADGVYLGRIRFLQVFDGLGAIGSYCDATEKEVIVWLYKVGDKFEAYLGDIMPIKGKTKFRDCKE